jgi:hypothetical protein
VGEESLVQTAAYTPLLVVVVLLFVMILLVITYIRLLFVVVVVVLQLGFQRVTFSGLACGQRADWTVGLGGRGDG